MQNISLTTKIAQLKLTTMEYLKLHTEEEFDRMSNKDLVNYENALEDTTTELGIELTCYSTADKEQELLNLVDGIKNPKKKFGDKYNAISKEKQNLLRGACRQAEKCRKAIVVILQSYIGKGELRFSKVIKTTTKYGKPFQFNTIRMYAFLDPITESYIEQTLSCEMYNELDGGFVKANQLPLSTLLEVVNLIMEDKAVLYSLTDKLICSRGIDELKAVLQKSGLFEDGVL
jgi:hypothetical protein